MSEAQCLIEKQDSRIRGGHEEVKKTLQDTTTEFKNDIAQLRERIQGMSTHTIKNGQMKSKSSMEVGWELCAK